MSKHNYSQYSNNKKNTYKTPEIEDNSVTIVEDTAEPVEETVAEVTETTVAATVEAPAEIKMDSEPKTITGIVTGCVKLNVRSHPKSDADVVCVIDAKSEVKIDMSKSNDDWFRVNTAAGVDGYCMRKFVDAKL